MHLDIKHITRECRGKLNITGSKSETNRLLLLQAFIPGFKIKNKSNSEDSNLMSAALRSKAEIINVNHAGTAMRFLTAYFSQIDGREIIITGSKRMQERPIKILVDALNSIGADISYEKKNGFPPLRIKGKKLEGGLITLPANISSQFISALIMLGPFVENGIKLKLTGEITSRAYIKMTLLLLERFGIKTKFEGQTIKVEFNNSPKKIDQIVESDWSSASYIFSIVALSKESEISLKTFKPKSLQGDSVIQKIYKKLGVSSFFKGNDLLLKKVNSKLPKKIYYDLSNSPDIAQTITVTCFGLGIECELVGLHTLKFKETDRLFALYTELKKLGANVIVTDKSLYLSSNSSYVNNCSIATYDDHRMAMAFAPLSLKIPLSIQNPSVVSKSYPDFWKDLIQLNFDIKNR
ncbi:3-phosphoshikimate 1-carboxyvinyltransferase [Bacteroidetes bacterium SCGC AAA795-G10]|nr:3-phosphoshikimate 1-carboxyvinyltransferase [Bacteroidetes bacterium SCGC AAA795-G10]